MSRKRKNEMGYCTYCGAWREVTRDHVPSLSLFSKPRPNDLITVPSCLPCNKGFSKDDEYFNIMVKMGIDSNRFPRENADALDTINLLPRPQSLRFARALLQRYRPNPSRFVVDRDRVGNVLRRIVRGLFYHNIGMRLPDFVPFHFVSLSDQPKKAAILKDVIDELTASLRTIGGGVFRYAFVQCALPDPFVTAWLLSFYDHRGFFCFTSDPVFNPV